MTCSPAGPQVRMHAVLIPANPSSFVAETAASYINQILNHDLHCPCCCMRFKWSLETGNSLSQ
eukprot:1157586-Pelagomonas_calceolata.AAC.4